MPAPILISTDPAYQSLPTLPLDGTVFSEDFESFPVSYYDDEGYHEAYAPYGGRLDTTAPSINTRSFVGEGHTEWEGFIPPDAGNKYLNGTGRPFLIKGISGPIQVDYLTIDGTTLYLTHYSPEGDGSITKWLQASASNALWYTERHAIDPPPGWAFAQEYFMSARSDDGLDDTSPIYLWHRCRLTFDGERMVSLTARSAADDSLIAEWGLDIVADEFARDSSLLSSPDFPLRRDVIQWGGGPDGYTLCFSGGKVANFQIKSLIPPSRPTWERGTGRARWIGPAR